MEWISLIPYLVPTLLPFPIWTLNASWTLCHKIDTFLVLSVRHKKATHKNLKVCTKSKLIRYWWRKFLLLPIELKTLDSRLSIDNQNWCNQWHDKRITECEGTWTDIIFDFIHPPSLTSQGLSQILDYTWGYNCYTTNQISTFLIRIRLKSLH